MHLFFSLNVNKSNILVSSAPSPEVPHVLEYSNEKYGIVDTSGLPVDSNDNPFANSEGLKNLTELLEASKKGFHFIFLVVKGVRRPTAMLRAYNMFFKALFPDLASRFVILSTLYVVIFITNFFFFLFFIVRIIGTNICITFTSKSITVLFLEGIHHFSWVPRDFWNSGTGAPHYF